MVYILEAPPEADTETLPPMFACTNDTAAGVDVMAIIAPPTVPYVWLLSSVAPLPVVVISAYSVPASVTVERSPG